MPAKGKSHKTGGLIVPYKTIDWPDDQSRPSAQANQDAGQASTRAMSGIIIASPIA